MKFKILVFLLVPLLGFAQKLKTKKDRILIDEKEVAIYDDKVRDMYVLSDLQGAKKLTVEYKTLMEGQTIINQWLVVSNADNTKKSEIPYEVLITSLSSSRITFHLLSAKYQLFDVNGFNQAKIEEFFNTPRESIGDKATQAKIALLKDREEKKDVISRYNPSVSKDGTVNFGGNTGTSIVGRITSTTSGYSSMGPKPLVQVYDLDNILVASASVTGNMNNDVEVNLFNSKTFTYQAEKRYSSVDNSMFYKELIDELVFRGYTLRHQAESYNKQIHQEKVNLAKERSRNLYKVKGYVIDEKGVKYQGYVTVQFEKLDINQTSNTEVVDAIDNYGKYVSVKYVNEKGSERVKTFAAKDNIKFAVIDNSGNEVIYEGMKVKGDSMKKLSNAMSLGFNNAYFYKVLFTEKENAVLVDPVEDNRFVLKLKSNPTGQMIDARENQKLSKELSEYLNSCPVLSKEIRDGAFDLKVVENLITIVKEYNQCKI